MKTKIFNKITTYLNYSLSREEQEILAKSNKILSELFETIEECTDNNMNDFDELILLTYWIKNKLFVNKQPKSNILILFFFNLILFP